MAQIPKIVNVAASYVPGDPNAFAQNLEYTAQEDSPEKTAPILAYEGYNFLPTEYGYKSYFGETNTLNIAGLTSRCSDLLMFQTSSYVNILIALCEDGIWTSNPATAGGAWTHVTTIVFDAAVFKQWTTTFLNGSLYCYQEANATVDILAPAGTWTTMVPTFLNMAGQKGIFRAGGRLGFWDSANSVSWSSALDYQDFTSSLTTMAGNTKFRDVVGNIVTILSHSDGFIIYSTKGIVGIHLSNTVGSLWNASVVSSITGISYPTHVCLGGTDAQHFVFTPIGLYILGSYSLSERNHAFQPLLTGTIDFIKESSLPVRLVCLEGRYLFISLADSTYIDGAVEIRTVTIPGNSIELLGWSGVLGALPAIMTVNQGISFMQEIVNPNSAGFGPFRGGGWDGVYEAVIDQNNPSSVGSYFTADSPTTHWGTPTTKSNLRDSASRLSYLNPRDESIATAMNTWDSNLSAFEAAQSLFVSNKVATPEALTTDTFAGVGTYPAIPADPADAITEVGRLIDGVGTYRITQTGTGTNLNSLELTKYFTGATRIDKREKVHYTQWVPGTVGEIAGDVLSMYMSPDSIAYNGVLYCWITANYTTGFLEGATSTDGLHWTTHPTVISGGSDNSPITCVWDGTVFCGVYTVGNGQVYFISSVDGINWSLTIDPFYINQSTGYKLFALTGSLHIIGDDLAFKSTDHGVTWSSSSIPYVSTLRGWRIAHNGTIFMAVPSHTPSTLTALVSNDGLNWTSIDIYVTAGWEVPVDIAVLNGIFYVQDYYQGLWSTPDGIAWTFIDSPLHGWSRIINTGNSLCAIDYSGQVSYSSDGTTWNSYLIGMNNINSISYHSAKKLIFSYFSGMATTIRIFDFNDVILEGEVRTTFESTAITGQYGYSRLRIRTTEFNKYQQNDDGSYTLIDTVIPVGDVPPVFDNSYPAGLSGSVAIGGSSSSFPNPFASGTGSGYGELPITEANPGTLVVVDPITITYPPVSYNLIAGTPAPLYPSYTGALVLDVQLKKWGKYKGTHALILDYNPQNSTLNGSVPYTNFGVRAGTLKPVGAGTIHLFDHRPTDSWIRYGKIGYYRLGYTQIQEITAHFRLNSTGVIEIECSLDGRHLENNLLDDAVFTAKREVTVPCSHSARWHTIKISGQWDLQYLEVRGTIRSRR